MLVERLTCLIPVHTSITFRYLILRTGLPPAPPTAKVQPKYPSALGVAAAAAAGAAQPNTKKKSCCAACQLRCGGLALVLRPGWWSSISGNDPSFLYNFPGQSRSWTIRERECNPPLTSRQREKYHVRSTTLAPGTHIRSCSQVSLACSGTHYIRPYIYKKGNGRLFCTLKRKGPPPRFPML